MAARLHLLVTPIITDQHRTARVNFSKSNIEKAVKRCMDAAQKDPVSVALPDFTWEALSQAEAYPFGLKILLNLSDSTPRPTLHPDLYAHFETYSLQPTVFEPKNKGPTSKVIFILEPNKTNLRQKVADKQSTLHPEGKEKSFFPAKLEDLDDTAFYREILSYVFDLTESDIGYILIKSNKLPSEDFEFKWTATPTLGGNLKITLESSLIKPDAIEQMKGLLQYRFEEFGIKMKEYKSAHIVTPPIAADYKPRISHLEGVFKNCSIPGRADISMKRGEPVTVRFHPDKTIELTEEELARFCSEMTIIAEYFFQQKVNFIFAPLADV